MNKILQKISIHRVTKDKNIVVILFYYCSGFDLKGFLLLIRSWKFSITTKSINGDNACTDGWENYYELI